MTQVADIREQFLKLSACVGPYDSPHRCSNLHCDHCGLCDISEEVLALIQQKQLETAKAYGGCTKCYGKGYATHIDATTAYADFGDEFGGAQSQKTIKHEMLFCTCERGKQLEVLLSTPPKKEDI